MKFGDVVGDLPVTEFQRQQHPFDSHLVVLEDGFDGVQRVLRSDAGVGRQPLESAERASFQVLGSRANMPEIRVILQSLVHVGRVNSGDSQAAFEQRLAGVAWIAADLDA